MADRAVVLAQLLADADLVQRRGEAGPGQRLGQHVGPGRDRRARRQLGPVRLDHRLGPAAGELVDRLRPDGLGEVLQRLHGQFVVGVRQPGPADIGEQVGPGRTAPAPLPQGRRLAGDDRALGDQLIEVPADRGRRDAQPGGQVGRGDGGHREQQVTLDDGLGAWRPVASITRHRCRGTRRERQRFSQHQCDLFPRGDQSRPPRGSVAPDTQARLTKRANPDFRLTHRTAGGHADIGGASGRLYCSMIRRLAAGAAALAAAAAGPAARCGDGGSAVVGAAGALNAVEVKQLSRLRRWGTVGSLLLMLGAGSSYGAATPIPNPVDGHPDPRPAVPDRAGRAGLLLRGHRADRAVLGADRPARRARPAAAAVPQPAHATPWRCGRCRCWSPRRCSPATSTPTWPSAR